MLYIDITRLYHTLRRNKRLTGVDRVSLVYLEQFMDIGCAVIRLSSGWLFFSKEQSVDLFNKILKQETINLPSRILRYRYKKATNGNDFLLHTAHNGLEDPQFLRELNGYNLRGIYFLHDLIPIDYPEYCRKGSDIQHKQRLLTMSKAALVICNSKYVCDGFLDYCDKVGLSKPRVIWAHLGINHLMNDVCPKPVLMDTVERHPFFFNGGYY